MFDSNSLQLLEHALTHLKDGFTELTAFQSDVPLDAMRAVLVETAERLKDNYPYPHPLYAGQMLKPPHEVARLAYQLAQYVNPNNHALDGGRASSAMEREAVAEIARMFGWDTHLGHLTGGGTMANLEALWIAGKVTGGKKVVASSQAHYTHSRICGVLGLPFESIPVNSLARMDLEALEAKLQEGGVGTVVATLGTTATGSCDPLPQIIELQAKYGFRIHVDSAYGGYYALVHTLPPATVEAYSRIPDADSIVVDPHKHGLQPYGCGCVLFRDPSVGAHYKHDSPYTYFSSAELHLGEISLECSRAGASAVALWATQRLFPLVKGGEFAGMLANCRNAAVKLHRRLSEDHRFIAVLEPELDIVVWVVNATTIEESSRLAREIFEESAADDLHLAVANLPASFFGNAWNAGTSATVTCLRSCLMKPEHVDWLDAIWGKLDRATGSVLAS